MEQLSNSKIGIARQNIGMTESFLRQSYPSTLKMAVGFSQFARNKIILAPPSVLVSGAGSQIVLPNVPLREEKPFIFEKVAKMFGKREYQLSGKWVKTTQTKPDSCRLVFELPDFLKAEQLFAVWNTLEASSVDRPVFPDKIVERLISGINGSVVMFFVPWGTRIKGVFGPETDILAKLKNVSDTLSDLKIRSRMMLMPADLYATEVNGIDKRVVESYLDKLVPLARGMGFEINPWSMIRKENEKQYSMISSELADSKIDQMVSGGKRMKLIEAASRWCSNGSPREAAYRYMRERICEAIIIEQKYTPIKLSAVTVEKDDIMDQQLPRVYLIPYEKRFPWLK